MMRTLRYQYNEELKKASRSLRKSSTNAEKLLWYKVRNRQLGGYKFRRQYPIDNYILDFYCEDKRLAIELDGGQHSVGDSVLYDERRTANLGQKGITVLRFWDNEVLTKTDVVLEIILTSLTQTSPPPSPMRRGSRT